MLSKGDVVSLHGTVTQHAWVDQEGEERTGLSLTVGSVMTARTMHLDGGGMSQKQSTDDSSNITIPEAFG